MKKKMILSVGIITILAVSVWSCMEIRAAKKPTWEVASGCGFVKIGTEILEEDSNFLMTGVLQQAAEQALQDISSIGELQSKTTQCAPDYPAMIMVDNVLYQDSEEISTELRCGMMDGSINSFTEGIPTENNQSNFGTGYGYQYGGGTIEVYIEDEWHIFIPYDTPSCAPDWDSLSEQERMEVDPTYFGE